MEAIICYMPVVHAGYTKLFSKHPQADLFIIGSDLYLEFPRTDREIRALNSEEAVKLISNFDLKRKVFLLTKENVSLLKDYKKIIAAQDDVTAFVVDKYLKEMGVEFDQVFLRWDRPITTRENIIQPGTIISTSELDREMIKAAFTGAEGSSDWWRQVGAVISVNDKILYTGCNHHLPTDQSPYINGDPRNNFDAGEYIDLCSAIHAETGLIARAAKEGVALKGASMYVTTFPCPVCARSIAEAGIKKVFYAKGYSLFDAEKILKDFGVEIVLVKMD